MARAQVSEIQRSRLVAAAVRAVEELGYGEATVAQITRRARVSRRTFYELFCNRDECLAAVLEEAVALVEGELAGRGLASLVWQERVRLGLWGILSFLDREPALARVCVVQAPHGGLGTLEYREQILGRLAAVVDEGRLKSNRGGDLTPLTAEGVVGAAFSIIHARLLPAGGRREPLLELHGPLMEIIVLPYLGAAAARRERVRPAPAAPVPADRTGRGGVVFRGAGDPLEGVSMRLTYRTARVLEVIAGHPGASNRMVAVHAEIHDQGQVSKLLARLERLGLLCNAGEGRSKGEPNAWSLTAKGEQVAGAVGGPYA